MRTIVVGFLVSAAIGAGPVMAQSFDCKLAKTPIEKAVCATPELGRQDEALSAAYRQRLALASTSDRDGIRAGQRAWLKQLAITCKGEGTAISGCLLKQYDARRRALESATGADPRFEKRSTTLQAKDSPDYEAVDGEEERKGYGTLHVEWAQAKSTAPEWQAWNRAVLQRFQDFLVQDDDKKTHHRDAHGWDQTAAADVDGDASATVTNTTDLFVSTHMEVDIMGHGAAHPSESAANFHWLLKEGRWLKASDVFRPDSGWKAFLVTRARKGLKAGEDADGLYDPESVTKALQEVTPSPENWDLTADGLTIEWPEYTVAPRVSMPEPVTISWKELKTYLAPGFVVPQ